MPKKDGTIFFSCPNYKDQSVSHVAGNFISVVTKLNKGTDAVLDKLANDLMIDISF